MKWFIDNWSLLVIIVCAVVLLVRWGKKFMELPTTEQQNRIKQCLLLWVIEAEKIYKSGLGVLKLRYCYEKFVDKFPSMASIVTFEMFSSWVDEVLVQMRHLLETNENVSNYVGGENGD